MDKYQACKILTLLLVLLIVDPSGCYNKYRFAPDDEEEIFESKDVLEVTCVKLVGQCKCLELQELEYLFINCRSKDIGQLPLNLPNTTTHLDLSWTAQNIISNGSFLSVPKLKYLKLAGVQLANIERGAFENLSELEILDLSSNPLMFTFGSAYPAGIFKPLTSLKILDMQYSIPWTLWTYDNLYPTDALVDLQNLEKLRLSFAGDLGLGFPKLSNLKLLTFDQPSPAIFNTGLKSKCFLPFAGETSKLEYIGLQKTRLNYIEEGAFANLMSLKVLDLSDSISLNDGHEDFMHNISILHAEVLYLNNTDITGDLKLHNLAAPRLKVLSLDNNRILSTNEWGSLDTIINQVEIFSISYNMLSRVEVADLILSLLDATRLRVVNLSHQVNFFDRSVSTCGISNVVSFPENLTDLDLSYTDFDFRTLCKEPALFNRNNSLKRVNLANAGIKYLVNPQTFMQCEPNVLLQIEEIDLSNNGLSDVQDEYFTYCDWSSLTTLLLTNNKFGYMDILETKETFRFLYPLWNINVLSLRQNSISKDLPENTLANQTELRKLDMSRMTLANFSISIKHMKKLESLDIRLNRLSCLSKHTMYEINQILHWRKLINSTKLLEIDLRLNPLKCNCECLEFYRWIKRMESQKSFIKLPSPWALMCTFDDGTKINLEHMDIILFKLKRQCTSTDYTFIINGAIFVIFMYILIAVLAVSYRFRHTLRYLWLRHRMRREYLERHLVDKEYIFHAFVSCDIRDAIFVKRHLLPATEEDKENPMKCCVAQRDFIVGMTIMDNILKCISQSHKVIFLVSKHFLKSGWCQEELLIAHNASLSRGKNMLIFVFMPGVDHRNLPDRISMIRNHITCIQWPETEAAQQLFWVVLRRAIMEGIKVKPKPAERQNSAEKQRKSKDIETNL